MKYFEQTIWLNGEFVSATNARWPLDDRGLNLGDGLFETLRIQDGAPRCFDAHWQRLGKSAQALHLGDPGKGAPIFTALCQLAERAGIKHGSARILYTRGPGPRGLAITGANNAQLLLRVFGPTPPPSSPIHLALSTVRRAASQPSSTHKTSSHLDMVLSRHWLEKGANGNESLLLDTRGRLCCVGIGNLFWLHGNTLYTPNLRCAVLPGTTRARVLKIAPKLGISIHLGAYWPTHLAKADTVFTSNALLGLCRAAQVDLGQNRVFSFATENPVFAQLKAAEATEN